MNEPVVVIGAGPAGLTAASELVERGRRVIVIEKTDRVGGIARTDVYKGNRFDIGGHRFFTRVQWVMDFWKRELGGEFIKRPRESHIYYRKNFFQYPVKPFDVLRKLGIVESAAVLASYAKARLFPRRTEETFEDYVVNHFGKRLFHHFFKSYTEKVWGIPTRAIRADWAAQRIKGMSITGMIKKMLWPGKHHFTSLIEEFYYPRLGPGQMWESVAMRVTATGLCEIIFNSEPVKIRHDESYICACVVRTDSETREIQCNALISSMPLRELFQLFDPPLPERVREAAARLHYRDFITVALVVNRKNIFSDTWIYVHDPNVLVGRIQNFNNWSPDMVADKNTTVLGLEYFVFETDELWRAKDAELVALARRELAEIGLAEESEIIDGTVVRMSKAYPMYDSDYESALPVLRGELAKFKNLYPIGRNGMHKYNNQDHAMYTAKLSVENMFGAQNDIWDVNVERVYHETIEKNSGEHVENKHEK